MDKLPNVSIIQRFCSKLLECVVSVFRAQFDFSSENVPERDPAVVENGIVEMKTIMETLKTEMVSVALQSWFIILLMYICIQSSKLGFQVALRSIKIWFSLMYALVCLGWDVCLC